MVSLRLLFLLLLVLPAGAQYGTPEVKEIKTRDGVILRVVNPGAGQVTLRLETTVSGATVKPNPALVVCAPGQSVDAMIVRPGPGRWRYDYQFQWLFGDHRAQHRHEGYRLPYDSGQEHEVFQAFNGTISHSGEERFAVDFGMPVGTSVLAARGGVVVATKDDSNRGGPTEDFKEYGNYIRILHQDGTVADYYHLRQSGVEVSIGQQVEEGQFLGYSGNTGRSTGPHLHFMVYRPGKDGETRDPLPIKFWIAGSENPVEPKQGARYRAP